MRDIFSKARIVRAWLGPADEHTARGIRFLQAAVKEAVRSNNELSAKLITWINKSISSGVSNSGWASLSAILQRPWWTRVWVLQEVAVANQVWVVCGNKGTNLKDFVAIEDVIFATIIHRTNGAASISAFDERAERQAMVSVGNAFSTLYEFSNAIVKMEPSPEFYTYLQKFRRFQSTDPRDKIYALLGVTPNRARPEISAFSPDYGIESSELYTKVASYYLHEQNMLEILHDCQGPNAMQELPSWAPDWSTELLLESILSCQVTRDNTFEASTQRNSSFRLLDSKNVLLVDGLHIDIIEGLGNQLDLSSTAARCSPHLTANMIETFNSWVCVGFRLDESPVGDPFVLVESLSSVADVPDAFLPHFNATYIGGGTKFEAWRRTLLCSKSGPLATLPQLIAAAHHMEPSSRSNWAALVMRVGICCRNRKFCLSRKGYMGLVPPQSAIGDIICLFFGLATPFIIRPVENGYIVIGDCYVQGLMDGEAMKQLEDDAIDITQFCLI